jgi:hypothetical protein
MSVLNKFLFWPTQFGDTMKTTYDYVDNWLIKEGRSLKRVLFRGLRGLSFLNGEDRKGSTRIAALSGISHQFPVSLF